MANKLYVIFFTIKNIIDSSFPMEEKDTMVFESRNRIRIMRQLICINIPFIRKLIMKNLKKLVKSYYMEWII